MNAISIVVQLLAGAGLGVLFYAGLWLTVRALLTARHPGLLAFGSFWIRTLLVLAGFLFLAKGRWENALICIAGFMAGRFAVSIPLRMPAARTKCP